MERSARKQFSAWLKEYWPTWEKELPDVKSCDESQRMKDLHAAWCAGRTFGWAQKAHDFKEQLKPILGIYED